MKLLNELRNIEVGQAIDAHEPTEANSSSINNPRVRVEVNVRLDGELSVPIFAPQEGIQKVRKVLHRYGLDMPALYDVDFEGDELFFDLHQFGHELENNYYLYLIYLLDDDGKYEFHAEVVDEEGMNEIASDDEDIRID